LPNLIDEVEIAINKQLQEKIRAFKQIVDREYDEAEKVMADYKERVRKEKEDEKFYRDVAKYDLQRDDLHLIQQKIEAKKQ